MDILGILYLDHDPAACLFRDGKIIAMAEEERFIRVKHADGYFPINAVIFCLKQGNVEMKDIEFIAIGWDINAYVDKIPAFFSRLREEYKEVIDEGSINWQGKILERFQPKNYTELIMNELVKNGYKKYIVCKNRLLRYEEE